MKTGLLFDMDGTLWDSAEGVATSWNEIIKKHAELDRTLTAKEIKDVMGITMDRIGEILFPTLSEEHRASLLTEMTTYENEYLALHGAKLYPKLEETLAILAKEYPLYIVSNCQSGYIEAFLSYYHFEKFFSDIECFGNNGLPKGKNIRLLADRNHLDEFYYIGDIQGDYDATIQAGGKFIHAAYGFGTIDTPVPELEAFCELPALLKELLASD